MYFEYSKIMIFGRPGSGKSTFALKLHQVTEIPLHHLDKFFYTENWIERNYYDFISIQKSFIDQDQWVIDGNCINSLEMRFAKADLVLFFNYPIYICFFRILKRLIFKDKQIDDRALRCKETISFKLLKYLCNFNKRVSKQISILKERYQHCRFIEIKSNQDLNDILHEIIK